MRALLVAGFLPLHGKASPIIGVRFHADFRNVSVKGDKNDGRESAAQ